MFKEKVAPLWASLATDIASCAVLATCSFVDSGLFDEQLRIQIQPVAPASIKSFSLTKPASSCLLATRMRSGWAILPKNPPDSNSPAKLILVPPSTCSRVT